MVAQLHEVIGRRCGGTGEPVRGQGKRFRDPRPCGAVVGFEDAGFIEHDAGKPPRVEVLQHLIVGDNHPVISVVRAAVPGLDAELARLAFGLFGHGQRGQHQHGAVRGVGHAVRPLQLHRRLT